MTIERDQAATDLAWVELLITTHAVLSKMRHRVIEQAGVVSVEVEGAHYEARAWRSAINGRILPSHIDAHGVRRQVVIGTRVQVQVVEYPVIGEAP